MSERTVVLWTLTISYYSQDGEAGKAISIFCQRLENAHTSEFTFAAFLKGYAKKGDPKH